ncbi:hypothetical protein FPZ42_10695 [Mucilaginibacter achroorhodeus]|uniref:Beta-lactamase-inhibitor-like PepSY-like domain-containing protein n=1 Tax=Mucilaginibacter achroorhodeus TaxID=2599294 RepID=A0A563U423_9SPHI|nr:MULTISPECIES: hypothetical protein [Mucilaginibacter]QXV64423.1 hypothetical protein INP83_15165 [Mucilaginibacter sp. 21P]TWR26090.1 hypothetical protein FPZ42_10695 [Mucilaginibacter achroorhodeus]
MKKLFITTAIAAFLSVNVFAGDKAPKANDDAANVSYLTINKFNNDFIGAENITWKVTPKFQKATFTIDGVQKSAFYNQRGELMGTTQTVQYNALPVSAQKEISKKYQGYFAKEVIKLENDENVDPLVYFVDVAGDNDEVLLKVVPGSGVSFFQKVK